MATKFVAGADVAFKGGAKFAIDPMGVFDSIEKAVACNRDLHPSFGYSIYEVEPEATPGLIRCFGFNQGKKTSGFKVIKLACQAYDHQSWSART